MIEGFSRRARTRWFFASNYALFLALYRRFMSQMARPKSTGLCRNRHRAFRPQRIQDQYLHLVKNERYHQEGRPPEEAYFRIIPTKTHDSSHLNVIPKADTSSLYEFVETRLQGFRSPYEFGTSVGLNNKNPREA